ncbi:DUF1963 domain-containing protein [Saccharothrix longispora]|uniref:DUF1963 domain-containing protein n=1 Tax=Saccharothrix longispora TaxID=33920 RepID=UPI0028FD3942|nr:DUF1963 domain-containing protein [Saccharothrix longispora]MDU0288419.1 DUF1963 domain-containing protein [Saccharothrix longispora]
MNDLQVFRRAALERGTPEPVVDWWLGLARPQLLFHRYEDSHRAAGVPVAGTYGGYPRLPADVEWDGSLDLVVSIDCATLPRDLPGFPLPADGALLFFGTDYEEDCYCRSCTPPERQGRVVHVPVGAVTSERVPPEDPEDEEDEYPEGESLTGPFPIRWTHRWAFPADESTAVRRSEEYREAFQRYDLQSFASILDGDDAVFALGGYALHSQDELSAQLEEERYAGSEDWRQLAEWATTFKGYGNTGRAMWCISREDLGVARFDRIMVSTDINM